MHNPATAVLTGDIIHSRQSDPSVWMDALKTTLGQYGPSPSRWDIFRGDSFQLAVEPTRALSAALHLKATIRRMDRLDVRIGIGIGDWTYVSGRITEAGGSAFIRSGEAFTRLKKRTLLLDSSDERFDGTMNLMLDLASLVLDRWTPNVAATVLVALENPDCTQMEIAAMMDKAQSGVSDALGRGGFDEMLRMLDYFKTNIRERWESC